MNYENKLTVLLILEIINIFEKKDLHGAKHFVEEIESLVRVIVESHNREE